MVVAVSICVAACDGGSTRYASSGGVLWTSTERWEAEMKAHISGDAVFHTRFGNIERSTELRILDDPDGLCRFSDIDPEVTMVKVQVMNRGLEGLVGCVFSNILSTTI